MSEHSRTIVGGRPDDTNGRRSSPHGIEILLKKAKVDSEFRDLLLEDPLSAASSIDLELSESERRILASTSKKLLNTMILKTFVPRHHVRSFLTKKAPALLMLVLASTVTLDVAASAGVESDSLASPRVNENTAAKLAIVQRALEQYKNDRGGYPSTEQWLAETNPLDGYVETAYLFDPWGRKLHYEGVQGDSKTVSNYRLESLGWDSASESDNVICPIDPELHAFPKSR